MLYPQITRDPLAHAEQLQSAQSKERGSVPIEPLVLDTATGGAHENLSKQGASPSRFHRHNPVKAAPAKLSRGTGRRLDLSTSRSCIQEFRNDASSREHMSSSRLPVREKMHMSERYIVIVRRLISETHARLSPASRLPIVAQRREDPKAYASLYHPGPSTMPFIGSRIRLEGVQISVASLLGAPHDPW